MIDFAVQISEHIQVVFIPDGSVQYFQKVFIGDTGNKVLVENKLKVAIAKNSDEINLRENCHVIEFN